MTRSRSDSRSGYNLGSRQNCTSSLPQEGC